MGWNAIGVLSPPLGISVEIGRTFLGHVFRLNIVSLSLFPFQLGVCHRVKLGFYGGIYFLGS